MRDILMLAIGGILGLSIASIFYGKEIQLKNRAIKILRHQINELIDEINGLRRFMNNGR